MRSALIPFALLVLLQIPAVAQAKTTKEAREKMARKACIVGNYQEGVNILADLFIESGDVNYVYNQARCLQQNHRWEEALDRFREYLRKATKIAPADRAEIDQHVSECEAHLAKGAPAPTPAPQPAPASFTPPPPVIAPATVAPVAPVAPPPPQDRAAGLRTAGFASGAVGLAGLGLGVFCSAKTYGLRDQPDDLDKYKTIGIVSYAVGGAALATGVTIYILGARRAHTPSQRTDVALIPAAGTGGGGLLLLGQF